MLRTDTACMNYLRAMLYSPRVRYTIAFLIGAVLGLAYFASAVAANADTSQVSIAANGQTTIRGAEVIRVSPNEILAITTWGSAKVQWRIRTSGSTRYIPETSSSEMTKLIRVGHTIGFSGAIDAYSASPTVNASVVRNESFVQSGMIIGGSVMSSTDSEIVVQTDTGTSTISVSTGTIMTLDGEPIAASDLQRGYLIKAFGTLNSIRRELAAERVTVALGEQSIAQEASRPGMLASFMAWLKGGSRTYSVR